MPEVPRAYPGTADLDDSGVTLHFVLHVSASVLSETEVNAAAEHNLAITGPSAMNPLLLAGALVVIGAALVAVARVRREDELIT